ncbi:MAG: hypothetical protein VX210_09860 [Myxococcota bacterium]|nr:hypothetical protein [Myxococcota bacterium]
MTRLIFIIASLFLLTACGQPAVLDARLDLQSDSLCAQAASHLASCWQWEDAPALDNTCEPDLAHEILAQPCEALAPSDPNQLWWMSRDELDALGCRLGWSYMCPVVGCDEEVEVDSCDDYQAIEDCRACQYYPCQEGETGHACGENGYFQGYGQKYCARFTQKTYPNMTKAGQAWLTEVRGCLMGAIGDITEDSLTCGEVRTAAFDSHPSCYVLSGLCALPPHDWFQILATISPWDNDLKQVILSGAGCLQEWF